MRSDLFWLLLRQQKNYKFDVKSFFFGASWRYLVKSYGFKKAMVDSCRDAARSFQHLNFCFPGKTELSLIFIDWEASADSLNFFIIFLSSSINTRKFKLPLHIPDLDENTYTKAFLNPLDFQRKCFSGKIMVFVRSSKYQMKLR